MHLLVSGPRCFLAVPAAIPNGLAPGASKLGFALEAPIAMSAASLGEGESAEEFAVREGVHDGWET